MSKTNLGARRTSYAEGHSVGFKKGLETAQSILSQYTKTAIELADGIVAGEVARELGIKFDAARPPKTSMPNNHKTEEVEEIQDDK